MADKDTGSATDKPSESLATPEQAADLAVELPSGGDLTPDDAAGITIAFLTRLVLVAGEAESGKTTLLTTIYEKFNEGPFANFLFAGSATLVGWEKRCHFARIASGAEKAETERTQGLKQQLLHLRVRAADCAQTEQDVLFTDLSGEVFKLIRDSTAECQQFGMLKRADHLVLLIDGKKLANMAARHEALTNSISLLRSCVDAGMVGPRSFVDVAFSKYDVLATAGEQTSEFLRFATETITSRFAAKVGRLRFYNIAARPESEEIEFGFGIAGLLHSWVEDSPYVIGPLAFPAELSSNASSFDRYLRVRLPQFRKIRA